MIVSEGLGARAFCRKFNGTSVGLDETIREVGLDSQTPVNNNYFLLDKSWNRRGLWESACLPV